MTRRTLLVVLVLLTVTGSAVGGWIAWSGRVAGDVAVTWSSESPACAGTTVRAAGSGRPVIEAVEAMRCVITVEVSNGSGRTVHVSEAVAPLVGPQTGTVVTAENAESPAAPDERGRDARFPIDRDLRAGESTEFEVVLVLNPDGCNDSGTFSVPQWPTVTVEVLGRSYDRYGDKDFAFHRDGTTPGCELSGREPAAR